MSFPKNKQKKQAEKKSKTGQAAKTIENKKRIIAFLDSQGSCKAAEIAAYIELSPARTRVLLSELIKDGKIQVTGSSRACRYRVTEAEH